MDHIQQLLDHFVTAAMDHGQALLSGEEDQADEALARIEAAFKGLKTLGADAREKLAMLMKHREDFVRFWAARYSLGIHAAEAERVLREVREGPSVVFIFAQMVLSEWERGNLTPE